MFHQHRATRPCTAEVEGSARAERQHRAYHVAPALRASEGAHVALDSACLELGLAALGLRVALWQVLHACVALARRQHTRQQIQLRLPGAQLQLGGLCSRAMRLSMRAPQLVPCGLPLKVLCHLG